MISVIVPVHNVEEYLPHCLDSLSEQTISESLEVFLINDGSTDSSPAICESYLHHHSNAILIHQENKGLSEARNTGIEAANGEWIYFLDADDWLAPQALQTLLSFAEKEHCDMVVGSFYYAYDNNLLYDDRWFFGPSSFILNREQAMRELVLQHYFKNFAWGKLYRTEIVKAHLFRPDVFFEDAYWQHLIVNETTTVGVITQPIYYYRQRKDSISGSFSVKNLDLLMGYRERLDFVERLYPELTVEMVSLLWNTAYQFLGAAQHSLPPSPLDSITRFIETFIDKIDSMKLDWKRLPLSFSIYKKCAVLLPVYNFGLRVTRSFFTKRLRHITVKTTCYK